MSTPDPTPLTLPDFLLARIADAEGDAHYLRNVGVAGAQYGSINDALRAVIDRVLDDCKAKRRIVALCDPQYDDDGKPFGGGGYTEAWWDSLRTLAVSYADHEDYREEWRP